MVLYLPRTSHKSPFIPKSPEIGSWMRITSDGRETARVACPRCGIAQSLADHEIATDGTVTPSALCDCGFHEMIALDGWSSVPIQPSIS
jgi:ribosomal protein S27AE